MAVRDWSATTDRCVIGTLQRRPCDRVLAMVEFVRCVGLETVTIVMLKDAGSPGLHKPAYPVQAVRSCCLTLSGVWVLQGCPFPGTPESAPSSLPTAAHDDARNLVHARCLAVRNTRGFNLPPWCTRCTTTHLDDPLHHALTASGTHTHDDGHLTARNSLTYPHTITDAILHTDAGCIFLPRTTTCPALLQPGV